VKRTNFYYPEALLDRLAKLRERTGIPVSEHIRRAVEEYLRRLKA
jgi:predicted DNA-binding protein